MTTNPPTACVFDDLRLSISGLAAPEESLAVQLARDMAQRWRRGETLCAEDYLRRHPQLADQPDEAVRLIYEEICLRQEAGEAGVSTEIVRRFPQWRAQLAVLIDCHRLLHEDDAPRFPAVGETFGDFALTAELGRGALGRVFLATQPHLADRAVVLKFTPQSTVEHLSLARLQHTNIVPLYWVVEDAQRRVRVLCMPYFGGATLAQLLNLLQGTPPERRSGQELVSALDKAALPLAPSFPAN